MIIGRVPGDTHEQNSLSLARERPADTLTPPEKRGLTQADVRTALKPGRLCTCEIDRTGPSVRRTWALQVSRGQGWLSLGRDVTGYDSSPLPGSEGRCVWARATRRPQSPISCSFLRFFAFSFFLLFCRGGRALCLVDSS